jgi:hypothetical protein
VIDFANLPKVPTALEITTLLEETMDHLTDAGKRGDFQGIVFNNDEDALQCYENFQRLADMVNSFMGKDDA